MDLIESNNVILSNERLLLREFNENDWIDVHKYASQDKVSQYQPWGPNTEKDTKDFIHKAMNAAAEEPRLRYVLAIVHKDDNRMIGAGEFNIRDFTNKSGEIGYIVNPEYWGKGIATSVAKLLIDFGFRELNLHRIYATCDTRNIGSLMVLERAGMTREGKIREDLLIKDGWRSSLLYSVLEYEWNK
ncbi:GNAT family N-acetyltransferase (plasmid) [Virgibacillus necropolis]|uniref:GNAT family N-acetyltransferase n=1 Tax=Virgibacillus necropolis TaxID=163877 RepID=UPI00384E4EE6